MLYFAKKERGFSYVEMVFAVAMLALLAAVATPYLEKNIQRKKESELKQSLRDIRTAIDEYKDAADAGKFFKRVGDTGYPHRLQDLVDGVEDITDANKKKLRFLRQIPADPMVSATEIPADPMVSATYSAVSQTNRSVNPADTWGKRSYDSDADSPSEGEDVYDIYSTSVEIGNNGVAYAKW